MANKTKSGTINSNTRNTQARKPAAGIFEKSKEQMFEAQFKAGK